MKHDQCDNSTSKDDEPLSSCLKSFQKERERGIDSEKERGKNGKEEKKSLHKENSISIFIGMTPIEAL